MVFVVSAVTEMEVRSRSVFALLQSSPCSFTSGSVSLVQRTDVTPKHGREVGIFVRQRLFPGRNNGYRNKPEGEREGKSQKTSPREQLKTEAPFKYMQIWGSHQGWGLLTCPHLDNTLLSF